VLRPDSDGATTIAPGVLAAPIDHRVTCYGFSVTEADKAGALDAQRATELGVVGKDLRLLKDLKAGKDVTLSDGRTVRSADCLLPPSPGRVIIHLGDCIDNSAPARAARGSGPCPLLTRASREGRSVALIVHEATFCDALVSQALPKGHCTARHAAAYAAEARADVLCLTHLSQRYLPRSHGPDAAAEIDALEGEARAELAARGASFCTVRCVEDFEAINAPSKK
jgi:ribonuclease Z